LDCAQAQNNSAPAAAVATPIGKVTTAKGTVSVEHAGAVVVQASIGGGEQTKVGDLVYKGDVILTGADSAVGIVFSDGTAFNLSSNARMVLKSSSMTRKERRTPPCLVCCVPSKPVCDYSAMTPT
jgi:hypothetical protein